MSSRTGLRQPTGPAGRGDAGSRSGPLHRLGDRALVVAQRLLRTLRIGRLPSQRPLPRVRIAMGPRVPGWVLRCSVGLVGLATALLLVGGPLSGFLAVCGAVLMVLRPSGIVCAGYALGLGLLLALAESAPFAPRAFMLLFGVHLMVQLGAIASTVPWSSVVDLRVLVSPARRFLIGQAFAQLLALLGAALSSTSVSVPWLPVLVGVGLTLLAWRVMSRLADPAELAPERDGEG